MNNESSNLSDDLSAAEVKQQVTNLVLKLQEEDLSSEEKQTLESLIENNVVAQQQYIDLMLTISTLQDSPESGKNTSLATKPSLSNSASSFTQHSFWKRTRFAVTLGTACLLLIAFTLFLASYFDLSNAIALLNDPPSKSDTPKSENLKQLVEPLDHGVAVIQTVIGVDWGTHHAYAVGDAVPPGELNWESGVIELEFYSGANIVAQGKNSLRILDASSTECLEGNLRVIVPAAASSFRLLSHSVELQEMQAELGVEVSQTGQTSIHVFAGTMQVKQRDVTNPMIETLEKGSACTIDPQGDLSTIAVSQQQFLQDEEMNELRSIEETKRYQSWLDLREELKQDPRTLIYYDFLKPSGRTLFGHLDSSELDGAIVCCEWTSGRWENKAALNFKRASDRVRVHIPGEYPSLSFAAWVKIDALDRRFNTLLLTDGFEVGEPHWQITNSGMLVLGVNHGKRGKHSTNYDTPKIFDHRCFGKWMYLVTVYDGPQALVSHYVNGKLINNVPITVPIQLKIGDAEIGNWGLPVNSGPMAVRNFNGVMDELILFNAALSSDEVAEYYARSRP